MKTNPKMTIHKCFSALFLVAVLFIFNLIAQTTNKQNTSINLLTNNIDKFLTVWLIKKDNQKALSFFSQKAFTNKEMLNDSCAGYIKADEYSNPNYVKAGINKFLQDFSSEADYKTLDEWLFKEKQVFSHSKTIEKSIIKLPKTTKYYLFKLNSELLESVLGDESRFPYLNRYFGQNSVLLILGLNLKSGDETITGYTYFIWSKENKNWKILHAGMFCV